MDIKAKKIKLALEKELPGIDSHKKLLPVGRSLHAPTANNAIVKRSSVLLLLFQEKGSMKVCLIKRPSTMKHHAGQIAFPGGKIEKGETALETAFRETQEEIGILKKDVSILGVLSDLYVEVSNFIIHPYVGWLEDMPEFSINTYEVDKMIILPLSLFKNEFSEVELNTLTGNLKVPCIRYNEEIIWGATAMILSEFYDLTSRLDLF